MINDYFVVDKKTVDIRKCNHREINVRFTLIVDESFLERTSFPGALYLERQKKK